MKVKTIFMGTPVFATAILEQLYKEEDIEIIAVVSQPDRPVGRKRVLTPTPVKELALQHGTPVLQPEKMKAEADMILAYQPELIITCAYGQMVPDCILEAPSYGAFNVHASLLPKLRGGAPIHKAIMYGHEKTGITMMEMVHKMDAGDMISKVEIKITDDMTQGSLHDALMPLGAQLLHETLPSILAKNYTKTAQPEGEETFAWNISKEEEMIDVNGDYQTVYNHIRSLIPAPVGYWMMEGKKVKLWGVRSDSATTSKENGTVLGYGKDDMQVAIDHRVLHITELQPEGKGRMFVKDFKNGIGKQWIGKKFETPQAQ